MKKKASQPEWALPFKRKGTEFRNLNGRYYLYEISSKWNSEKKRSGKITGRLLGSITEAEGFVESEKSRLRRQQICADRIQVKEYGITAVIDYLFADMLAALKQYFPDSWQRLVILAYGRLVYQSPFKNMPFHYSNSYLSEAYPDIDMSGRSLGSFLRDRYRVLKWPMDNCRQSIPESMRRHR